MEEKRKEDFYTKQAHHEQIRQQSLEKQREEKELYLKEQELIEKKRKLILKQTREEEEVNTQLHNFWLIGLFILEYTCS